MLKIINDLQPFIKDCYRRIHVREFAKLCKISPPTASKVLRGYEKEGLLSSEEDKGYILYFANKQNKDFIDLSRMYWRHVLQEFCQHVETTQHSPTIILFGSLAKAETTLDSDVDIVIISSGKVSNYAHIEQKIQRNIQLFHFKNRKNIKNKELGDNIVNGYVLRGRL
jgi:predicted nucleotidyltransferase